MASLSRLLLSASLFAHAVLCGAAGFLLCASGDSTLHALYGGWREAGARVSPDHAVAVYALGALGAALLGACVACVLGFLLREGAQRALCLALAAAHAAAAATGRRAAAGAFPAHLRPRTGAPAALALALVATNAAAVACSLFAGWMRHGVRLLDLQDAHDEREQEEGARRKQQ